MPAIPHIASTWAAKVAQRDNFVTDEEEHLLLKNTLLSIYGVEQA
jgi:hypothetical protein